MTTQEQAVAIKPVSDLVKSWCNDVNAKTGAIFWALACTTIVTVCSSLAVVTINVYLLALSAIVLFLWIYFAPKRITYGKLKSIHSGWFVEDSLLELLADSQEVPVWIKREIANELANHQHIKFLSLFEIEERMSIEEEKLKIKSGKGYKKITSFGNSNN